MIRKTGEGIIRSMVFFSFLILSNGLEAYKIADGLTEVRCEAISEGFNSWNEIYFMYCVNENQSEIDNE